MCVIGVRLIRIWGIEWGRWEGRVATGETFFHKFHISYSFFTINEGEGREEREGGDDIREVKYQ